MPAHGIQLHRPASAVVISGATCRPKHDRIPGALRTRIQHRAGLPHASLKVAVYAYKSKYRSCSRIDETSARRDYYDLATGQRTQSNDYHADGTKERGDSYHPDATIACTERYDRAIDKITQAPTYDPMRPELPSSLPPLDRHRRHPDPSSASSRRPCLQRERTRIPNRTQPDRSAACSGQEDTDGRPINIQLI